uniref:Reverse transcriptase domain-containing protein n=1 Tax=Angiostrongylus cantonensis TaxID=6313 RepID=A0A0K0D023_ANGCA
MGTLEWDNMGVKIDGRQIHLLRFVDDIVLTTPNTRQAEPKRMLADFDKACGKIGLRLSLKKMMSMKNGLVSFASFTLNETDVSECFSCVYLGRENNSMNDLAPELSRWKRAVWRAFKSIEDVAKRTKNTQLCAHLSTQWFILLQRMRQKPGGCVSGLKDHSELSNAQWKGRC